MHRLVGATIILAVACAALSAQAPGQDRWPKNVAEFRNAVQQVLNETGVPGAGIALVRTNGVEWAGGVGLADRDRNIPVTADTHFRAGSISKTFIASAVVQAYLDDILDLDAPVSQYAPEVAIDNAWDPTDPVRVIHLLQHTAGFDDMHFNEIYAPDGPELSLKDVLNLNPASRIVRWQPGTRMSYSNPGYAVAALVLENVSGKKYEEWIEERIFKPTGMPTSSFHLTKADEALLAKGYDGRTGPPVPYSPIYLRPAGNLHTSALELGKFVQLLLNWGETQDDLVIDPEYLSNMEHPRTTLASQAGLRNGYGTGIMSFFDEGFPMLGHNGGIEGFSSSYGYSTSRDVGYVVLLNSRESSEAMRRIRSLAVRYLKADVEPPPKPAAEVPVETLQKYAGYYHDAAPRNQASAFLTWLLSGQSIAVDGKQLRSTPVFGDSQPLVPTSETMFRLEGDPEPTRVFVPGDAEQMILTGGLLYAERWPRWRIEGVRWAVLASAGVVLTSLPMAALWIVQGLARRGERGGTWLKFFLALCGIGLVLPALSILRASSHDLGTINVWSASMFAGSVLLPAAAILSFLFAIDAWRSGARPWMRAYSLTVSIAALIISGYLSAWGMIGFRPWSF